VVEGSLAATRYTSTGEALDALLTMRSLRLSAPEFQKAVQGLGPPAMSKGRSEQSDPEAVDPFTGIDG
jgi:hypothetical protein